MIPPQRVRAAVVFADLTGFTAAIERLTKDEYIAFMTDFRETVLGCLAPYLGRTPLQYGFWGDEVKAIFHGPDDARNARDALEFARDLQAALARSPLNEARRAAGEPPVWFKTGIATDELSLGIFPGAVAPEFEGRALLTARSLSKWAKQGTGERIFLDPPTTELLVGLEGPKLVLVADRNAFEVV